MVGRGFFFHKDAAVVYVVVDNMPQWNLSQELIHPLKLLIDGYFQGGLGMLLGHLEKMIVFDKTFKRA